MEAETVQQPEAAQGQDPGIAGLESVFSDLEKRLDELVAARLDAVETKLRLAQREALAGRFAAEHPDFQELQTAGALAAQRRNNPLLDDVGAYFAHHLLVERQARSEAVAAARAEAETEAEGRALERFRAKRLAQTLCVAPAGAGRGEGTDPQLGAPEKFGGINAVLAARFTARRKAAGN